MPRYVALLRGVNVGGNNKVPMADLRDLFVSLGYADAKTYIQSGNVVFTSPKKVGPSTLESAVSECFDLAVTIVLRTHTEMARVLEANPFAGADPSTLHVGFMAHEPPKDMIAELDAEPFRPDEFEVVGSNLYMHLPNGIGRAKLPVYLNRQIKVPTTVRNWNTVTKLTTLASG